MLRLFLKPRTLWLPTLLGWFTLGTVGLAPAVVWLCCGEAFLSQTRRESAEVLVVESWIGMPGVAAAKQEFESAPYQVLISAGALTNHRWGTQRWNFATLGRDYLLRRGFPAEKVWEAPARATAAQRTYESALAVKRALTERNLQPTAVNVVTLGAHARRSRLIFARVLGPDIKVGVISWRPQAENALRWWQSSERAEDFLKESVAYPLEFIAHSGRGFAPPGTYAP